MDPTEASLVLALRAGDGAAFGRVHALLGPRVWSFLSRMCGRRELAEDLYQETWIKLAVNASRLTPETDLMGWLYTVARNLVRSERRFVRARPEVPAGEQERAYEGASPFDWTAANETQARLERALAELPASFREVLVLVVVEGLDHERVAAILELSPEALRQRLARARAKLAERYDELTKDERGRERSTS